MAAIDRESQAKRVADIIFADTFALNDEEGLEYFQEKILTEPELRQLSAILADYLGDNEEHIVDPRFLNIAGSGESLNAAEIKPLLSQTLTEYFAIPDNEGRRAFRARVRSNI